MIVVHRRRSPLDRWRVPLESGTVGQCSAEVPVYRVLLLFSLRISQPLTPQMTMTATAGIVPEGVRGPALLQTPTAKETQALAHTSGDTNRRPPRER